MEEMTRQEALDMLNEMIKDDTDFVFPIHDIVFKRLTDVEYDYPVSTAVYQEYSFLFLIKTAYNLTEKEK